MQYIKKGVKPPDEWENWFTVPVDPDPRRTYDYGRDATACNIKEVKQYLLAEQHNLCAYCQRYIVEKDSSVEHVMPKQYNKERSTCYTNLVAVCKTPNKDPLTGRDHCDRDKGSLPITPFIFLENNDVNLAQNTNNAYFTANPDGTILPRVGLKDNINKQVEAFIDTLNLNHSDLKTSRSQDYLNGIVAAMNLLNLQTKQQKKDFWKAQFAAIVADNSRPYRQYLLIVIARILGAQ
ncbi:retron system putative HNH endonuclease [Chitinophaga filiformis]|uniref:TIGR02646 family protein n=1 Tax=Chitinophaga filiformis TaxID=104663 RepID=A0A1G7MH94_CHIFI|nr:retron system putative HNH endonuclease [Chitinophaga filiformis]SDF61095.1 TIGR02646 family protein [Chitinophaga filiformis]